MIEWLIKDKKRLNKIFIWVFLISFWIFISASEDELVSALNFPIVEWMFCNVFTGNSIFFNLTLGFIVSGIFYFFISYLPEKRRVESLKPVLSKKLESIIDKQKRIFEILLEHSTIGIELTSLDEKTLTKICSEVNPSQDTSAGTNQYTIEGVHYWATPGVKIVNVWFQLLKEIEISERTLLVFNDGELTSILLKLEKEGFTTILKTLINTTETNLKSYESILAHILKTSKQLSKYYKENINPDYKEPFGHT